MSGKGGGATIAKLPSLWSESTACAIVPLKPNELTPHAPASLAAQPCVGSEKRPGVEPSRSPTSGLSTRSCALPAAALPRSSRWALSKPTCPDGA